jgi:hypothetical protein
MHDKDGTTPVLPDQEMRALGFTDHREGFWYLCREVESRESLNITIEKSTGDYEELVMDEDFGQPAYYGNMIEPYRSTITQRIDDELARLNAAGLTLAVDHSAYSY